jgi:uncharacterized membrane protein YgcG
VHPPTTPSVLASEMTPQTTAAVTRPAHPSRHGASSTDRTMRTRHHRSAPVHRHRAVSRAPAPTAVVTHPRTTAPTKAPVDRTSTPVYTRSTPVPTRSTPVVTTPPPVHTAPAPTDTTPTSSGAGSSGGSGTGTTQPSGTGTTSTSGSGGSGTVNGGG